MTQLTAPSAATAASAPREQPLLGMLLLDGTYMEIPGALMHPETFRAPVVTRVVPGAAGSRVVGPEFAECREAYVESARELAANGVDFITSNCGFTIAYQDDVAAGAGLPSALSSLLLLPMLARVYGGGLGVMTYDASQLDDARRAAARWPEDVSIPVMGVEASPAWRALTAEGRPPLDIERMRGEILQLAQQFVEAHGLRALLLECTGFSPFRREISAATGVPCYDAVSLVHFLLDP